MQIANFLQNTNKHHKTNQQHNKTKKQKLLNKQSAGISPPKLVLH